VCHAATYYLTIKKENPCFRLTEGDLTVNGARLHYTAGKPAGPPLVLQHGFSTWLCG